MTTKTQPAEPTAKDLKQLLGRRYAFFEELLARHPDLRPEGSPGFRPRNRDQRRPRHRRAAPGYQARHHCGAQTARQLTAMLVGSAEMLTLDQQQRP